jgi:hypothetical protein
VQSHRGGGATSRPDDLAACHGAIRFSWESAGLDQDAPSAAWGQPFQKWHSLLETRVCGKNDMMSKKKDNIAAAALPDMSNHRRAISP